MILCESDPTNDGRGVDVLFYILIYINAPPEAQESALGFWSCSCGDPWLCERRAARRKLLKKVEGWSQRRRKIKKNVF